MKRVLVIGANSYIGKKFYEYVGSLNEKLIEIDMVSAADGSWEKVDFSLYDTVLHLSAIVHRKENKKMKDLYEKINHKLPVSIASKAKDNHVKQFIFMSTVAVYGDINGCITKDTIPKPLSLYGRSKLYAEDDIQKLKNIGFKIAIIRSPMVYGEGCKGNYQMLSKFAAFTPVFPNYHNKRSKIHVDKLNYYLLDIILHAKEGLFYPQDKEYGDTCAQIMDIRKRMGKKTYLTVIFNGFISYLKKRVRIINKMFGDLYYDVDMLL